LQDLQQRRREIDEMCATLAQLVALCKGDDDPHCAILEQLSAPSAAPAQSAPVPARKNLKQVRAGSVASARMSRPDAQAPEPVPHAGLMAWSRGLGR
jgi:hypothetical protein